MANSRIIEINTRGALKKLQDTAPGLKRSAESAITAGNEKLAIQVQQAEVRALERQVRDHGRLQRRSWANSPIREALLSEQNREVGPGGFQVNIEEFLDSVTPYWRQLEHGAQGRKQELSGLFVLPYGKNAATRNDHLRTDPTGQSARAYLATRRPGFTRGAAGGGFSRLDRPRAGDRSAVRFAQFTGRGSVKVEALIGPRDPYRYIATAHAEILQRFTNTDFVRNTFRKEFAARGVDIFTNFRHKDSSIG